MLCLSAWLALFTEIVGITRLEHLTMKLTGHSEREKGNDRPSKNAVHPSASDSHFHSFFLNRGARPVGLRDARVLILGVAFKKDEVFKGR